ncbi:hypothetical protein SDC9_136963 [bioreactor metagenome]|uniref:Uncharacterized protein n=1 Tax=bioreactor metagenome TaxID=1076179 RepID=A0A645DL95_9ZZZZ
MRNDGHFARAQHDGNRNKPALAEDNIRLKLANQPARLKIALDHAKWIDKVLPGEIAPQFPRRNLVIGHSVQSGDEALFHTAAGADVVYIPAFFEERLNERDVRGDMTRRSAAGEDNAGMA